VRGLLYGLRDAGRAGAAPQGAPLTAYAALGPPRSHQTAAGAPNRRLIVGTFPQWWNVIKGCSQFLVHTVLCLSSLCHALTSTDSASHRLAAVHSWARLRASTSSSHPGSGITAPQPAIMTVRQSNSETVGVQCLL